MLSGWFFDVLTESHIWKTSWNMPLLHYCDTNFTRNCLPKSKLKSGELMKKIARDSCQSNNGKLQIQDCKYKSLNQQVQIACEFKFCRETHRLGMINHLRKPKCISKIRVHRRKFKQNYCALLQRKPKVNATYNCHEHFSDTSVPLRQTIGSEQSRDERSFHFPPTYNIMGRKSLSVLRFFQILPDLHDLHLHMTILDI